MSKRGREYDDKSAKRMRGDGGKVVDSDEDSSEIEFEDDYEDEYEEEDIIENEDDDEEDDDDETTADADVKFKALDLQDDSEEEGEADAPKQIWRKELRPLEEDEVLECDPSAYDCYHTMNVTWPCLSFDIIPDKLGEARRKYPHTMYLAAGSQATHSDKNSIMFMKITNIQRTKEDEDSDDEDDEEDDPEGDNPEMEHVSLPVQGSVNKIKMMPQEDKTLIAAWLGESESKVAIYDVKEYLRHLDVPGSMLSDSVKKPYMSVSHPTEGFALDWNPNVAGRLLSADCNSNIYEIDVISQKTVKNAYGDNPKGPKRHSDSVEDLQWSPREANVFISCSVDKTIKVWDARADKRIPMLSMVAHSSDVNVLNWNKKVEYLIASGSDDCSFSIWDLRKFNKDSSVAHFAYHDKPICSLDWNPHDNTQIAVASEDDTITIWDMSLEPDEGDEHTDEFPPQLYFVHQGQREIKEVKWHPKIMNMVISTAEKGFNVFKTINAAEAEMEALTNSKP